MKQLIIIIAAVLICQVSYAQKGKSLESKLQGKTKLHEVMAVVEDHYAALKKEEEKKRQNKKDDDCPTCNEDEDNEDYIHWKRWEYFNRARVADDGTLQNIFARNNTEYKSKGFDKVRANSAGINAQSRAFNPVWVSLGPSNITNNASQPTGLARANNLAFHPTDPNTFWAATSSGGVFKTTNAGFTWTSISDDISSLGAADVVVDYTNTNVLYVLTGDGESNNGWNWFVQAYGFLRYSTGVLKSVDGGATWQPTALVFNQANFNVGFKLAIHPTNPNILLAATNLGLYRTDNGGDSWTLVVPAGPGATKGFNDVDFNPNNGNIAYASGRDNNIQMLLSVNAGVAWSSSAVTGLPSTSARFTISPVTNNGDSVYVVAADGNDSFQGLYRGKVNAFNALNFSFVIDTPNVAASVAYNFPLAVNAGFVCTGGLNVYRSINYGKGFTLEGAGLHADVHSLQYNPLDGTLYAACDGGVYKSTDNGLTFSFISFGLRATQIYHMAGYEPDANKLLIGTQDNGTNYKSTVSVTIKNIGGCDGFAQAFHPSNSDSMLFICNSTVYRSYDNGATNSNDINPSGHNTWYSLVGFNSLTPKVRYVGGELGFYRQPYINGTWSYYPGVRGNSALRICPNSNRIYIAGCRILNQQGGATLYRTDNDCTSFVNLRLKPGMPVLSATTRYITGIYTNPNNNDDVWITVSGYQDGEKVYHSVDAGENWDNESDNLPNVPVNSVAVDADGNVYVGNDFGIFARRPGDTEWFPFYNGMPNVPVTDLVINETAQKIRAATFGRGIWEADLLLTSCPLALNITGTYVGQYNFSAATSITTTATAVNSSGTKLTMNAGNYILLNDGFRGNAGAFVKIQVAPCGPVNTDKPFSAANNYTNVPAVLTDSTSAKPPRRQNNKPNSVPYRKKNVKNAKGEMKKNREVEQ